MSRTFQVTDGTTTISLLSVTGIIPPRGGFGGIQLDRANLSGDVLAGGDVAENFKLNIIGSSHDNVATQIRALINLLRKAQLYWTTNFQTTPVYLVQQTTNETNARYALVKECYELRFVDVFNHPFEIDKYVENFGLTIVREHPWRSEIPGTLPTAITLTKTDGPADGPEMDVGNARSSLALTYLYNYDASLTAFSANLAGTTGIALWSVSGSTPAAGDILYIGGEDNLRGFRHFVIDVATAGSFTADIRIQAYISGAWTDLAAGSGYTIYPSGAPSDLFKSTVRWVINVEPGANWQTVAINGATVYWIRILLNGVTSWITTPVSHGTYAPYFLKKDYIEIPNTAIGGDLPPKILLRLLSPAGALTDPVVGSPSRILIGAKSRGLTNFQAFLNTTVSSLLPSGWARVYGTDAAAVSDQASPVEGFATAVSFATDSTMVARITLTGTAHLTEWVGRYSVFLIAQQIGGANGDTQVRMRTFIGGSSAGYPSLDSETAPLASHDAGYEIIDLGRLALPFGELTAADSLGTDLIFQLLAERITGSSTLRLAAIVLMPIDEWACTIEDPLSNLDTGSSALRGLTAIDLDGGILRGRTLKYVIAGSTFYPAETWNRDGRPPTVEPAKQTRIYFLMMHYPVDWGVGPMMAPAAMHLAVRVYTHDLYNTLRGND